MRVRARGFVSKFGPFDPQAPFYRLKQTPKIRLGVASDDTVAPSVTLLSDEDDIVNIFTSNEPDLAFAAAPEANLLRSPQRSRLAQGRLVALRRKSVRSKQSPAPRRALYQAGQTREELRAMRAIFTYVEPVESQQYSLPLRIATHSINMSLIMTALPIGAAALTYNLLRGEDMTFTARLTTLTGLVLAIFGGGHTSQLLGGI